MDERSAEQEQRTPQEWCDLLGARVMDPDGWRDGTRAWDEPIARAEFDQRIMRCTIDMRGYPEFRKPADQAGGSRLRCTRCGEWGHLNTPCPNPPESRAT